MDLSNVVRDLRSERERLASELASIERALSVLDGKGKQTTRGRAPGRRKLSAKGREAIARAARKRWAAWRKANK